jgi:hypothetical protein
MHSESKYLVVKASERRVDRRVDASGFDANLPMANLFRRFGAAGCDTAIYRSNGRLLAAVQLLQEPVFDVIKRSDA